MDIGELDIVGEIGAMCLGESDVKFDEMVFVFGKGTWRACEDELYYDAILGELMNKDLIKEARKVEV